MVVHLGLVLALALTLGGLLLLLRLGLVHLVEEGQAGSLELVGLGLELLGGGSALAGLVLGDELAESTNLLTDLLSLSLVQTVLEVLESLLGVVQDAVGAVGGLDGGLALLVLLAILLGVLNHGLDLVVGQTGAGGDGDRLVLVGGLVLGVDVDDGVSVDVEGDLDLGNATVSRGDADQLEVAEQLVVTDELTLTLEHLDLDSGLEIGGGREGLGLLGGDGGVAVDQTGEDTAEGLDTQGQRGDIEQQNVSDLTSQDGTLDGSTDGHSLVGVDGLGGFTAKDGLDGVGDLGHTGHTTDQDDILDLAGLHVGILEGLADGLNGAADQGVDQRLEVGASHAEVDVLGTAGISGDEGQVDLSLKRRGQLNLGLLGGLTDTLDGHAVTREVKTGLLLELADDVTDQVDVEVLTTQVGVTVGGLDLEHTLLDLQNGDIESTTAKIVDGDNTVSLLLQTVGQSGSSGLVDDTQDVQTGDLTGVLGGLTLRVIEVGRNGNDGVLDGLAEVVLSSLLHLAEDETTDLRRRVLLATGLDPGITVGVLDDLVGDLLDVTLDLDVGELATDETLGGEQSVLRVDDGLTLGGDTDQTLAILGETDNGGRCPGTFSFLSAHSSGKDKKRLSPIPSVFSMILGVLPSMTATAELVVPRNSH